MPPEASTVTAEDKLERYPLVPADKFTHLRSAEENRKLEELFRDGRETWAPADHFSGVRTSILLEARKAYAANVGLSAAAVQDSEIPAMSSERETVALILEYWKQRGVKLGKGVAEKLQATRTDVLELLLADEDMGTVYGLLQRWGYQTPGFYEKTGLSLGTVWQMRDLRKRTHNVTPYAEVVKIAADCGHRINGKKDKGYDAEWAAEADRVWFTEAIGNMQTRGVCRPVALFHAYAQKAGLALDGLGLGKLLGSPMHASTLSEFDLAPYASIKRVLPALRKAMGPDLFGEFEAAWKEEEEARATMLELGDRKTFELEMGAAQKKNGIGSSDIIRIARITVPDGGMKKVQQSVRNVSAGATSASLSPGEAVTLSTPNPDVRGQLKQLWVQERYDKLRRTASSVQFSDIGILSDLWGIAVADLVAACNEGLGKSAEAYTAKEILWYQRRGANEGDQKTREAHVVATLNRLGNAKADRMEDLQHADVLLQAEEEVRLAEASTTVQTTFNALLKLCGSAIEMKRRLDQPDTYPISAGPLRDYAAGKDVPSSLPALTVMVSRIGGGKIVLAPGIICDWFEQIAAKFAEEKQPPLARVMHTIVRSKATNLRQFLPLTQMSGYQTLTRIFKKLEGREDVKWTEISQILAAASIKRDTPTWVFVHKLHEAGKIPEALAEWRDTLGGGAEVEENQMVLPGLLRKEIGIEDEEE